MNVIISDPKPPLAEGPVFDRRFGDLMFNHITDAWIVAPRRASRRGVRQTVRRIDGIMVYPSGPGGSRQGYGWAVQDVR